MNSVKIRKGDFILSKKNLLYSEIEMNSVGLVIDERDRLLEIHFIGKNKKVKVNFSEVEYLDVKKTGKPYSKKICNICHILKDNSEFSVNQTDAKGMKTTRPSCKSCRYHIDGKPLRTDEKIRLDKMKPKGLFTCPICSKTSIVNVTANLVRDHDHLTGMGRAWICDSCNTGLGRFKDDLNLLQSVINYLKEFK